LRNRDIAMVFQNYALYPHMSVFDNMAYGLRRRHVPKPQVAQRVTDAARILGLDDVLRKKPGRLSGGQRQRVAMGRAIVREPQAFLMDEPLSNLDAKLRVQMRAEIARIQRDLNVTTIYVTHDQSEAMTLGDRVAVMRGGFLQQIDAPEIVYDRPVNLFVAAFIGSPAMNLFQAELTAADGALGVRLGGRIVTLDERTTRERPALARYAGRRIAVGLRPEDIEDASLAQRFDARLTTAVDIRENLGSEVLLHFNLDAPPVDAGDVREVVEKAGRFVARVNRQSRAAEGSAIELGFQTRDLHFFDLETGDAIHAA
jgi:multiple sugar transport system ATP-binding protein